MIDPLSVVFTKLKVAVFSVCKNAGTTNSESPSEFPFLAVLQEDNASTAEDLENNENAVISVIKLEIYSKVSVSEAKKIMTLADNEMRRMGYQRKFGPHEVTNMSDTKIKRIVARYKRIVGGGDIL